MIPAACAILCLDVTSLVHHAKGTTDLLGASSTALIVIYYAVLIWCYLRRGPAVATSGSVTAHAAALGATWLPFVLPLLHGTSPGTARQAFSDALLIGGTAWSVWSLRYLGRNVSVLAQVRGLADQGPYRWVRHPLYAGELLSALGVVAAVNSVAAVGLWLALAGLQVYRAMREEQVLLQTLPAYRAYRNRTAALVPGLF